MRHPVELQQLPCVSAGQRKPHDGHIYHAWTSVRLGNSGSCDHWTYFWCDGVEVKDQDTASVTG